MNETAQLYVGPSPQGSANSVSLEPFSNPIPLKVHGGERLYLLLGQQGEVIKDGRFRGEYRITTRAYHYAVLRSESEDTGFLSWDWHPGSTPDYPYPHIHVPIAEPTGRGNRLHVPTGKRVTVEQVVGFLIQELLVEPAREDWAAVLEETQHRYDVYQAQDRPP